jgi:hypothetical protein
MPEFHCGLFKKSAVTVTSNSYSAKKEVKPDQVKGAIASLSMLSERGIAPFPDRRVACGQLSTPAARDSSLPSRAVATFPTSALNSAFTSAFIC